VTLKMSCFVSMNEINDDNDDDDDDDSCVLMNIYALYTQ